jgi:hypothetical protein
MKPLALVLEKGKALERDYWTSLPRQRAPSWADTDPVHPTVDGLASRLPANPTYANDGVEIATSDTSHAVFDSEKAILVRVAFVGSFVNKGYHHCLPL